MGGGGDGGDSGGDSGGSDGGDSGGNTGGDGGDSGGSVPSPCERIQSLPGTQDATDDPGNDGGGSGGEQPDCPDPPENPDDDPDEGDGTGGDDRGPETVPPSELARTIEIPADAVSAKLHVTTTAVARKPNAEAELSVVTDSGTETLLAVAGSEGGVVSDEVSTTLDLSAHAGETVKIRVRTENNSTVELGYVAVELERDSDGDGLTNSQERMGFRTGWDGRVYTDPYSADSDGDGLSDGREVGQHVASATLAGGYYLLESNPAKVDSDGDGLSDHEEATEPLPYAVTTSRNASVELLRVEDPSAMAEHLATGEAWADPMRVDTDGDGLGDREELVRRTNVADADSDGDGTLDGMEVASESDPTLFDAQPPAIDVRYAAFETVASLEFTGTEYRLIYVVEDASGVKRTQVVKKDEVRYSASWPADDFPGETRRDAFFRTGVFETAISSLTGTTVDITATDGHGNRAEKTGLERANFYSRVAVRVADEDDIYAPTVATYTAWVSGFAASLGSTADAVKAFAEDPLGFIEGLKQLIALLDELGLLDKLVEAIAQEFAEKQERNNPYDSEEHPGLYKTYKYNWYAGYVVGFVAEAAVGASATKAVKSTETFQRVADYVGSTKVGTVYRGVRSPYDRGKARVAAAIVEGADRASAPVLRRAKSVGATYRLWRLQRNVDACPGGLSMSSRECGDPFAELSDEEKAEVADLLARDGEDASEVLDALSSQEKTRIGNFLTAKDTKGENLLAQMDAGAARAMFKVDGRPTDFDRWDEWRKSLVIANSRSDVSPDDISEYVSDIQTLSRRDNVENFEGLVKEVQENPQQIRKTAFEAERAEVYSRSANVRVEPDPNDRIDYQIVGSSGSKYIEAKKPKTVGREQLNDALFAKSNSIMEKFKRIKGEYDLSDGERIAELDARGPLGPKVRSNGLRTVLEDLVQWGSNYHKFPGDKPFDKIKLVTDDGIIIGRLDDSGNIEWSTP